MHENSHIQTVIKDFSRSREREPSLSVTLIRLNMFDYYKKAEQSNHEGRSN